MSATGRLFSKWLQKRSKCYNLNANYPFFLNLHRTWSVASVLLSRNQSKVKALTERRGVDSRMSSCVAQGSLGGHFSFFSLFLSLLFCLKIFFSLYCRSSCWRSGYRFLKKLKVCSIFQHACFFFKKKRTHHSNDIHQDLLVSNLWAYAELNVPWNTVVF